MDVPVLVGDGGTVRLADCPASSWKPARLADDAASRPGTVLPATTYSPKAAESPDAENEVALFPGSDGSIVLGFRDVPGFKLWFHERRNSLIRRPRKAVNKFQRPAARPTM